jgi:hypothetical protein
MLHLMAKMQGLKPEFFEKICFIATDMDGTLTQAGRFTPTLLSALEDLAAADIPVLIITGRSAGWVSAIAHYLPVTAAIAENGGVVFLPDPARDTVDPEPLVNIVDWSDHRLQLAKAFAALRLDFPTLQEAADNRFRMTDWTFDVAGWSHAELDQMRDRVQAAGWGFTYSTVQCHIKRPDQEKSAGLLTALQRYFPDVDPSQVLTVGDSPNDESLFNPDLFPCSVGVANLRHYVDRLHHQPRYLTTAEEAAGFCELSQCLLQR